MAATTTSTLSSVLDELDHAISVNFHGLVAGQEAGSEESSILDLRDQLRAQFDQHGDCDLSSITLNYQSVPFPAWVPRTLTDAIGVTQTLSASEALAKAIAKPKSGEVTALTSAVGKALSIRSASEKSFIHSESARPSGLAAAERHGTSPHASGPSSTTTLLNTTTMHDHDQNYNQHVSLQPEAQRFTIGSTSRASGSTRAAARAELELELALAKEHRINMQLQALEASSSRGGSDAGSLADRLSLVGLGSSNVENRRAAPRVQGAARSSATHGADAEAAAAFTTAGNQHETDIPHANPTGHLRPESQQQLPILRPQSLPHCEEPPSFGASINYNNDSNNTGISGHFGDATLLSIISRFTISKVCLALQIPPTTRCFYHVGCRCS